MNSADVGVASEMMVAAEFAKHGFTVSFPLGGVSPYDLIVERHGRLWRVQVKTAARQSVNTVTFHTRSSRSKRASYVGLVDLFAVFHPDTGSLFLIPVSDLRSTTRGTIVLPPGRPQSLSSPLGFIASEVAFSPQRLQALGLAP